MGKEKKQERAAKAAAKAADANQINQIVQYGSMVVVLLAMVATYTLLAPSGHIEQLSVDRPDQLKEALFGGQPWLVSCYADGDLHSAELKQASDRLLEKGITTGVIDCRSLIPGKNKTVYKRLGLKATDEELSAGKRTFFCGNGRKAVELDPSQVVTENNLVRFATRYADLWVHQPRTMKEMTKVCYKKPACVVVTTRGKPMSKELTAVKAVGRMHRTMPVVLIDLDKTNFTGYTGPVPMMGGTPKLTMFRKPEAETDGVAIGFKPYKKSMGNVDKMATFVETMLAAKFDEAGLETLDKEPHLVMKKLKSKKKSKRSKEEIARLKAESKAARRDREKERRAQMDEEMGDLIQEADEGEGDEEDEELDTMELDDGDEGGDEDEDEAEEVEAEEVEEE